MAKQLGEEKVIHKAFDNLRNMGYALKKDYGDFGSNYHDSEVLSGDSNNKTNDANKVCVAPMESKRAEDIMSSAENNGVHTSECATKEYVQKEHKETTRLIIGVVFGMVTIIAVAVGYITSSFEKTVGVRLETLATEIRGTKDEIKDLRSELANQRNDFQKVSTSQAKIEGYLISKQTK